MHPEHLQNVRPVWVLTGWLVAVAATSLVVLALIGFRIMEGDIGADALWGAAAVAVGFGVGGFFIGFRSIDAPILHAIGVGITSLLAWFLLHVLVDLLFALPEWTALTPGLAAAIMFEQMAAAVLGAWIGHRIAIRGGPEPEEPL
ncbi:MAG: hypothetical protein HY561_12330 [Gemmatimonadetes bacterium]|nr:hypothetical protein [Gemmatimonadota bacterium]